MHIYEKVIEAQVCIAAQKDRRGISYQRGGALQITGYSDGDYYSDWTDVQSLGSGQRYRGNHQNSGHIVHKCGNQACEQAEDHNGPLHTGYFFQNQITEQSRHTGVDDQSHKAHGAGDHQQNVEIYAGQDLFQGKHTAYDEDHG